MLRIHCKIALCFLISLFDLSAILKIRNGEHAHYVGLVVAYTWNREKQIFVALGKEFDMTHSSSSLNLCSSPVFMRSTSLMVACLCFSSVSAKLYFKSRQSIFFFLSC